MGWHLVMSLYSWYVCVWERVVYFSPEILGSTRAKTRMFSWACLWVSLPLVKLAAESFLVPRLSADWDAGRMGISGMWGGVEGDLRRDYCGSDGRRQETACVWGLHISGFIFWFPIKLGDYEEGGKAIVQGWNQFRILFYCFSYQFGQWWLYKSFSLFWRLIVWAAQARYKNGILWVSLPLHFRINRISSHILNSVPKHLTFMSEPIHLSIRLYWAITLYSINLKVNKWCICGQTASSLCTFRGGVFCDASHN